MRTITLSIVVLMLSLSLNAQTTLPVYPDSLFSTYYHQRWTLFQSLPNTAGDILFVGNSITDGGEWQELFDDTKIKNRGISGDISAGVIHRLPEIAQRRPAKVFLLIGVNDLARNIPVDSVVKNILLIAGFLKERSPSTQVYVQSILPVNRVYGKFNGHTSKQDEIVAVNNSLRQASSDSTFTFINLHASFADATGKLKRELSNDGLHLNGEGYLLWKHLLYPYVYNLQERPSLIPQPQQLQWDNGMFSLTQCRTILITDSLLLKEARRLETEMLRKGLSVRVSNKVQPGEMHIKLALQRMAAPVSTGETYRLEVTPAAITVAAPTRHGIFNGIQTLLQLMRDGVKVDACRITDWPAFEWRGFMVDVGRNYQSMDQLKQQIDVMSKYKLNVFHFHATEDIAWRIAIKQYPQLTAPETMLRNKGMYYSESDIRELIEWCRERHITFVPEIDMPGHSAAFKRAMKTDMQSDTGLQYVKNILKEFCETYDVPYIHIGADEVKITNKNFVPEVSAFIEKMGRKVIGWQPGGNFNDQTIRQLWMDDNAHRSTNTNLQFIDSRHLYINHMDPLEAVVTIFNREIGDRPSSDKNLLGGTICVWHDRAAAKEEDVLQMNPVYPSILSFAERSWRGGGQKGWTATIGTPKSATANTFAEFENRLLDHRFQYFSGLPFPYAKQSSMQWQLYGPFDNKGDLSMTFDPEKSRTGLSKPVATATGGTIIWRHWWAPLIKGVLENPKENSTWYAGTRIWSEEERMQEFWIGFNNLSRSPATDSPKPGTWDNHQSKIWVNGREIAPPTWKRGGQKGHPEIPLTDEGYEYRSPVKILLQKGWNEVLVKSPIGSFKGKDWQNPEKWMFTFVPVNSKD